MGKMERKEAKADREAAAKASAKDKAAKADEARWDSLANEEKSKAAKKREEEERKKAEAAAKKAEAKRLAEEEEEASTSSKAKAKSPANKVTAYQLAQQREQEEAERQEQLKLREMAARREVHADHYAASIETENINRLAANVEGARSVEAALAHLGVMDESEADKHPEKRAKAAYKAYEEKMIPQLKQEKPGLKMSQYKEMLWKMWQKAPENPFNQAAAAAARG